MVLALPCFLLVLVLILGVLDSFKVTRLSLRRSVNVSFIVLAGRTTLTFHAPMPFIAAGLTVSVHPVVDLSMCKCTLCISSLPVAWPFAAHLSSHRF